MAPFPYIYHYIYYIFCNKNQPNVDPMVMDSMDLDLTSLA